MNRFILRAWFCAPLFVFVGAASLDAQPVTLLQTVEPSFRVEPIVHRFKARRGEVIPFEFAVTSSGKAMDVEIRTVSLRQEESGLILHDADHEPEHVVKIHSERNFRINAGETRMLKGEITVPLPKTNFLSFGILVTDNGTKPTFDTANAAATQAGIRFVTQYVLRVDVEIEAAPSGQLSNLKFAQGQVVAEDGSPVIETVLENPTNYSFEFQVRGSIDTAGGAVRSKPFPLGMLSRAELQDDERYLIRLMPRSKLRLKRPLEGPVLPGDAALNFSISNGRREVGNAKFYTQIDLEDFPALQTQMALIDEATTISPAYVELGQVRGSKRISALKVINQDDVPKKVSVEVKSLSGEPMPEVNIAPRAFDVLPGRTKTLRAIMRADRNRDQPSYGVVHLTTTSDSGKSTVAEMPLALWFGAPAEAQLDVSDVQLRTEDESQEFTVAVANKDESFVPVNAELIVSQESGRALKLTAGYGRWLGPGEESQLRFKCPRPLTAGEYQLSLRVDTHEGHTPVERRVVVQLKETSGAGSADSL